MKYFIAFLKRRTSSPQRAVSALFLRKKTLPGDVLQPGPLPVVAKDPGPLDKFVGTQQEIHPHDRHYVTLMPVIVSLPFLFNHPYAPMNLIPFVDVLTGRGDFLRQVLLNVIMTMPFGFLFPLAGKRKAKFGRTVFFCFFMTLGIELLQLSR